MAPRKGVGACRKLLVLHPPPPRCSRILVLRCALARGTRCQPVPAVSGGTEMFQWCWDGLGAASMLGWAVLPVPEHPGTGGTGNVGHGPWCVPPSAGTRLGCPIPRARGGHGHSVRVSPLPAPTASLCPAFPRAGLGTARYKMTTAKRISGRAVLHSACMHWEAAGL